MPKAAKPKPPGERRRETGSPDEQRRFEETVRALECDDLDERFRHTKSG